GPRGGAGGAGRAGAAAARPADAAGPLDGAPAVAGPLAGPPGQPADRAGDGQPRLDVPLRQGAGGHAPRLRADGRAPLPPGTAGLAGGAASGPAAAPS